MQGIRNASGTNARTLACGSINVYTKNSVFCFSDEKEIILVCDSHTKNRARQISASTDGMRHASRTGPEIPRFQVFTAARHPRVSIPLKIT